MKHKKNILFYIIYLSRVIRNFIIVITTFQNWWLYYLDYAGVINTSSLIFCLRNGKKFYATPHNIDGLIISEIWGNRVYQYPFVSIEQKDTVVDIGAHKGFFSVYASMKASKGKVYAFEPIERNFELLSKNISVNHCKNVNIYPLGIAKEKGKKQIFSNPDNSYAFTIIKQAFKNFKRKTESLSIPVISLDDILIHCKIKKIDFLKIDCEGAEFEIFLNASPKTLQKIDKISMEFHQLHTLKVGTLVNLFKKSGFTVTVKNADEVIGMLYAYRKS